MGDAILVYDALQGELVNKAMRGGNFVFSFLRNSKKKLTYKLNALTSLKGSDKLCEVFEGWKALRNSKVPIHI